MTICLTSPPGSGRYVTSRTSGEKSSETIATCCSGQSSGTVTIARMLRQAPRLAVISAPTRKRILVCLPSLVLLSLVPIGETSEADLASFDLTSFGAATTEVASTVATSTAATAMGRKYIGLVILLLYFARRCGEPSGTLMNCGK